MAPSAGTDDKGTPKTYTAVVTKKTQAEMKRILKDIKSGKFAKRFIDENNKYGRKTMNKFRNKERGQKIEVVGAKLLAVSPCSGEASADPLLDHRALEFSKSPASETWPYRKGWLCRDPADGGKGQCRVNVVPKGS